MELLNYLDEVVFWLNAGFVFISILRLLHTNLKLKHILKSKRGKSQKYGFLVMKYVMVGLSSVGIVVCVLAVFFTWKENSNLIQKIQSLEQWELIFLVVAFFMMLYVSFCGFAFLYMGYIWTEDELIFRGFIKLERIPFAEIREQAKVCKPVLKNGKLILLLKDRIVKLRVIEFDTNSGFEFTNKIMKRCGIPAFPRQIYMDVMQQRKPKYEEEYAKMKRIYKNRKHGKSDFEGEQTEANQITQSGKKRSNRKRETMEDIRKKYAITSWEDAPIFLRLLALKNMICCFNFWGSIIGILFGCVFVTATYLQAVESRNTIKDFGIGEFVFGIILVFALFVLPAIMLVKYLKRIFKLFFGHPRYCTAKIDYVHVKRQQSSSGTLISYSITLSYGSSETKETKTIEHDQFIKNFKPTKYEGEYITAITPDMEFFVLRKIYRVRGR